MSTTVDNRVVKLVFDNEDFEENIQDTIDTLKEFEEALKLDGAESGLEEIEEAADKLDISTIGDKASTEASNVDKAASEAGGSISQISSAASNVDMTAIGSSAVAESNKVADASSDMVGDLDKIGTGAENIDFSAIGTNAEKESSRVSEAASAITGIIDRIGTAISNLDFSPIGSGAEQASNQVQEASADAYSSIDRIDDAASDVDFSPISTSAQNAATGINDAASSVSLSPIVDEVQQVEDRFNGLQTVISGALFNLGKDIEQFARNKLAGLKNAIVNPIKEGFGEYEEQIGSIQTILANTGRDFDSDEDIAEVNDRLDELNKYADDTIYKFGDMTKAIGQFTTAGLDLDEATLAVQGLANMAAFSGASSTDYHGILPQVAQALTSGTVQLMDWKSFENRSMGGQPVVDFFANFAEHMAKAGLVGADADEQASIIDVAERLQNKTLTMRQSLNKGESPNYTWFDSSILSEALQAYTFDKSTASDEEIAAMEKHLTELGYSEEEMEHIFEIAELARRSATEVRTFSQLVDTTAEAIGSNWTQIWMNFIGDFKESTATFTFLSESIGGAVDGMLGPIVHLSEIFDKSGAGKLIWGDYEYIKNNEDDIEKVWNDELGRYERAEGALDHLVEAIAKPIGAIGDAIADVFEMGDDTLGEAITGICMAFSDFTESLVISDDAALALYDITHGLGSSFKVVMQVIADVVGIFLKVAEAARVVVDPLLDIALAMGGLVGKLFTAFCDEILAIHDALGEVLKPLGDAAGGILGIIDSFFKWADIPGIIDDVGNFLVDLLHTFFEFIDIPGKLKGFSDFISNITDWFKKWLDSGNPLIDFISNIGKTIVDTFKGAIDNIHNFFSEGFFNKDVLDEEGNVVGTEFGRIQGHLDNFKGALENVAPIAQTFWDIIVGIGTAAGGIVGGIVGLAGSIAGLAGKLGEMFLAWEPVQNLKKTLEEFRDGVIAWFLDLPNKFTNFANDMSTHFDNLKGKVDGVVKWFEDTIGYLNNVTAEQFIEDFKQKVNDTAKAISDFFDGLKNITPQNLVNNIDNVINDLSTSLFDKMQSLFDKVKEKLNPDKLSEVNSTIAGALSIPPDQSQTIEDTYNAIIGMIKGKFNDLKGWFHGIANESESVPQFIANILIEIAATIRDKFEEIKNNITSSAEAITPESIVDGFRTAMYNAIVGVHNIVRDGIDNIIGFFNPELASEIQQNFVNNIILPLHEGRRQLGEWLDGIAEKSESIPDFIVNIFKGIGDVIKSKIDEFKQQFEGLTTMESLEKIYGDISEWADSKVGAFFDNVGSVFSKRFPELSSSMTNGFDNVKGSIKEGVGLIAEEIDDSLAKTESIPGFVLDIFGKILEAIKEGAKNVFDAIKNFEPADLWSYLQELTSTVRDKIREIFPDVGPDFEKIMADIWLFFNDLRLNSGTWKDLASNVGNALKDGILSGVDLIGKGLEKVKDFLGEVFEKIKDVFEDIMDWIGNKLSSIPGPIGDTFGTVEDRVSGFSGVISENAKILPDKFEDMFSGLKEHVDNALDNMKRFWDGFNIADMPAEAFEFVDRIKEWVGDKIDSVAEYIKNVPDKLNSILDKFKDCPDKIADIIENVKKVLNKDTFNWILDVVEQILQIKKLIRSNNLLKSTDKFVSSASGLLDNVGSLVRTMNTKMQNEMKKDKMENLANFFKDIGKVFLEMAGALFIISLIPDPQGCMIIVLEIAALLETINYLPALLEKIGLKGSGGEELKKMADALLEFCLGMYAITFVIKKLTNFDWESNMLGVEIMAGCFGALVVAAILLSWFGGDGGKNIEKAAQSLMWMSIAAGIIAIVVTKCSQEINLEGAKMAAEVIGAALFAFWLLVTFTNEVDAEKTAKALMKFSEAVAILSVCIYVLSGCDYDGMALAIQGIDSMLAIFGVIVHFTTANDLMTSAKALDLFSVAVGVMAYSLYELADKDWQSLVGAAGAIDVLLAGLGAVTKFTEKHDLMEAAKAIDVFSIGVGVMAYALYELSDKDWDSLVGAAASIDVLLLGLMAITRWTTSNDIMKSAAAIDVFSVAVGIMAVSLYALADKDWQSLLTAAGAIDAVIAAFAVVVKITSGTDLVTSAAGLDLFALAVAAIAASLYELSKVDAEALQTAVGALNDILIPFEILVGILSIPVLSEGASIVLPGLATALAALGLAALGVGEGLNLAMDALQKLVVMGPVLTMFVELVSAHVLEFADAALGLTALGASLVVLGAGLGSFGVGGAVAGATLVLICMGIRELLELCADLPELLSNAGEGIGQLFSGIGDALGEFFSSIGEWWTNTALPWISEKLSAIGQAVGEWISKFGEFYTTTIQPALDQLFGSIGEWWTNTALPAIGESGKSIGPKLAEVFSSIGEWFTNTGWPLIQEKFKEFSNWFQNTALPAITGAASKIGEKLGELFGSIGKWFEETGWPKIKELAGKLGSWFTNDALPAILKFGGEIVKILGNILSDIGKWIVDEALPNLGKMIGDLANWFVTEGWPKLKELGGKLFKKLGELLTKLGEWMVSDGLPMLGHLLEDIVKKLGELGGKLIEWVGKIPGWVGEGLDEMWDKIVEVGGNIVTGILEGITSIEPDAIWKSVCSMGDSIISSVKDFFGIQSPSKLMEEEVGRYIPEGIALGLKTYGSVAGDAAEELGAMTAQSINDGLNAIGPSYDQNLNIHGDAEMGVTPVINGEAFDVFTADLNMKLDYIFGGINKHNEFISEYMKLYLDQYTAQYEKSSTAQLSMAQAICEEISENRSAINSIESYTKELGDKIKHAEDIIRDGIDIQSAAVNNGLQEIREELESMDVLLDGNALVGELTPRIDQSLGYQMNMTDRGVYR